MDGHNFAPDFSGLPRLISLIWPLDEASPVDRDLAQQLRRMVLDRLGSDWGRGVSCYAAAPFLLDAHISAGWQDPRTPRDLTTQLLSYLDAESKSIANRSFRDLDDRTAEEVLTSVISDSPRSGDARTGFSVVRQLTYDVLFSDTFEAPAIGWDWLDRRNQAQEEA